MGSVLCLVFPGLGLVILPSIALGNHQWGGLAWVGAWATPAVLGWYVPREHRLDGDLLVSTYHNRVAVRSLRDVVDFRPARWRYPAARMTFADGSGMWVFGSSTEAFIAVVLDRAPFANNQLPPGRWLRPRRILWWAAVLVASVAAGG